MADKTDKPELTVRELAKMGGRARAEQLKEQGKVSEHMRRMAKAKWRKAKKRKKAT
jgi:hypothetical protein